MSSALSVIELHISLGRDATDALRIAQANNNAAARRKIVQADKVRVRLFFYSEDAGTNVLTATDFATGTIVAFGAIAKDGDGTEIIACNTFVKMTGGGLIWYEAIVNCDTDEVNALFASSPTKTFPIYINVQVSDLAGSSATERGTRAWIEADLLPDAYKDGASAPVPGTTWGYYVTAPATATDPGELGMQATDGDYLYICVAHNTWKRALLATF